MLEKFCESLRKCRQENNKKFGEACTEFYCILHDIGKNANYMDEKTKKQIHTDLFYLTVKITKTLESL